MHLSASILFICGFQGYRCSVTGTAEPPDPTLAWNVYVLRCGDGSLYCGVTNNLPRRLARHEAGTGARYTRGRGPLLVAASWPLGSRSAALRAEAAFKALPRPAKERLVARPDEPPFPWLPS